jgi:hypothetical protein
LEKYLGELETVSCPSNITRHLDICILPRILQATNIAMVTSRMKDFEAIKGL